jgi:hypothetical protein
MLCTYQSKSKSASRVRTVRPAQFAITVAKNLIKVSHFIIIFMGNEHRHKNVNEKEKGRMYSRIRNSGLIYGKGNGI